MMLKDSNPDEEAADAQIQPIHADPCGSMRIHADLSDDDFEYRKSDQSMDQRRNQIFSHDRSEPSHLTREQQQLMGS
jgi:hypothetical protein